MQVTLMVACSCKIKVTTDKDGNLVVVIEPIF